MSWSKGYPEKPLGTAYTDDEWMAIVGHHEAHLKAGIVGEEITVGNFDPRSHCEVCRPLKGKAT